MATYTNMPVENLCVPEGSSRRPVCVTNVLVEHTKDSIRLTLMNLLSKKEAEFVATIELMPEHAAKLADAINQELLLYEEHGKLGQD